MSGIYIASRVAHAARWIELRDKDKLPIISTWIDEAGAGETKDFTELWTRVPKEVEQCSVLLFYGDVADAPWKGALVEVGMALALGKPVVALIIGELEGRTQRPLGSWLASPGLPCGDNRGRSDSCILRPHVTTFFEAKDACGSAARRSGGRCTASIMKSTLLWSERERSHDEIRGLREAIRERQARPLRELRVQDRGADSLPALRPKQRSEQSQG